MRFRNRCMVAGANGLITLSIPLALGRDQKTLAKDVRLSPAEGWQKQHWKSIISCYNRSPWFEHYRDQLEALYQKPFIFLADWNLACFEWAVEKLGVAVSVLHTDDYIKTYDPLEWNDQRDKLLPGNYVEGVAVKYRQVFEDRIGFQPNLSILDLLFCEGKSAADLLGWPGKK